MSRSARKGKVRNEKKPYLRGLGLPGGLRASDLPGPEAWAAAAAVLAATVPAASESLTRRLGPLAPALRLAAADWPVGVTCKGGRG